MAIKNNNRSDDMIEEFFDIWSEAIDGGILSERFLEKVCNYLEI